MLQCRVRAEPADRGRHLEDGGPSDRVRVGQPHPEVDPFAASKHAAIVATGRSDYPKQINNVLAFPGLFRGMLDSGAHEITDECLLAAATAIADCVTTGELNTNYIVPSVSDPAVAGTVRSSV